MATKPTCCSNILKSHGPILCLNCKLNTSDTHWKFLTVWLVEIFDLIYLGQLLYCDVDPGTRSFHYWTQKFKNS
jgi:hypothetical protein